jgi:hypothetical protein
MQINITQDKVTYLFENIRLQYNKETGATYTYYPDDKWSGCDPIPEDDFHANILGITNKEHRLEHELIHHVLGFELGHYGSPIIDRDAHSQPQPQREAELEEWKVTAFQYFIHEKKYDKGAMMDLLKDGVDIVKTRRLLVWLLQASRI